MDMTLMMLEDAMVAASGYFLFFAICAVTCLFIVSLAFLACYFLYMLAKAYALIQRYTVRAVRRRFLEGRI